MSSAERILADEASARGLAVVCGADGVVRGVLRNELGVADPEVVGQPFSRLLIPSSEEKAQRFFAEVVSSGAAFDWELGVPDGDGVRLLHFAGAVATDGTVIVVGAETRAAVLRYYDELMRINNEQANALRSALKRRATQQPAERSVDVYDKMMRVNNELATLQREITKKNRLFRVCCGS